MPRDALVRGATYTADGAVWLRSTDFGDDKDRVLLKADGDYTYFASDTAYYVDKRARGFDVSIYLLGADHHGYVNRLRAELEEAARRAVLGPWEPTPPSYGCRECPAYRVLCAGEDR